MKRFYALFILLVLSLTLSLASCDAEDTQEVISTPQPQTVELHMDQGIVFGTGEVITNAGGKHQKLDLVVYKAGDSFQLKTGTEGTTHMLMHRFTQGGLDKAFASLDEVPTLYPDDADAGTYLNKPEAGSAVIIKNNMSADFTKIYVKSVGEDKQSLVIDYLVFP